MADFLPTRATLAQVAAQNELQRRLDAALALAETVSALAAGGDAAHPHLGTLEALLTDVDALAARAGPDWPAALRATAARLADRLAAALVAARAWAGDAAGRL